LSFVIVSARRKYRLEIMIFYGLITRRFLRRSEAETSFVIQPASLKGGRGLGSNDSYNQQKYL
jgi:hypothetical protein